MSFVLRNATQNFQIFIDEVLCSLEFSYPYLDEVLVTSKNEEKHLEYLRWVFGLLQELATAKYVLIRRELKLSIPKPCTKAPSKSCVAEKWHFKCALVEKDEQ